MANDTGNSDQRLTPGVSVGDLRRLLAKYEIPDDTTIWIETAAGENDVTDARVEIGLDGGAMVTLTANIGED